MSTKGELRSAQVVYGALCVMISGNQWMHKLSAGNWDTQQKVNKSPTNIYIYVQNVLHNLFIQELLHFPLHTSVKELVQLFWTMFTVMVVSPLSWTVTTTIIKVTVHTALMLESGVKVIRLQ